MNDTKETQAKTEAERERMKSETISKWDAWNLVTKNTIAGNFFNDLDEAELWEKLLELPPANKKAEGLPGRGEAPGAKVRPVVEADMVNPFMEEFYGTWYHCSACKEGLVGPGDHYCPNCGAVMREAVCERDG